MFSILAFSKRTDIGIVVEGSAGINYVLLTFPADHSVAISRQGEFLSTNAHGEVVCGHSRRCIHSDCLSRATFHKKLSWARKKSSDKDQVLEEFFAPRVADRISAARRSFGCGPIPVHQLIRVYFWLRCTGFVRGYVWLHEFAPSTVGKTCRPLGRAVVAVMGLLVTIFESVCD